MSESGDNNDYEAGSEVKDSVKMSDTGDNNDDYADSEVKQSSAAPAAADSGNNQDAAILTALIAFCGIVTVTCLAGSIALGYKSANTNTSADYKPNAVQPSFSVNAGSVTFAADKPFEGQNPCEGKKLTGPDWDNVECVVNAITSVGPQSGANVTKGYKGEMSVDHGPLTTPYWQNGMCPVNVHWHLGAEHYSLGQYDEKGTGPEFLSVGGDRRALAEADDQVRSGYKCQYYNPDEARFNKKYVWEHCVNMLVGETYEVHWPHSSLGDCGTPNQYQEPFYDGVFCHTDRLVAGKGVHEQIGVQAQVFTIVNDESYYYPDLIRGMIVDGEMGADVAKYTGSTTGTSRSNSICSKYSPITWQVDRTCHLISASSFDKMCADMKAQRDDMSKDLYAHGSRELVADFLAANNGERRHLETMYLSDPNAKKHD